MQIAYLSTIPLKNVSFQEHQRLFEKKILPLCSKHSDLIESTDNPSLYMTLEFNNPLLPLYTLQEEIVPKFAERVLVTLGSSKLLCTVALKCIKEKKFLKQALAEGKINIFNRPQGIILQIKAEKEFLAPLPLSFLPLDEKEQLQLLMLGVKTIGELRDLPLSALTQKFGQKGYLWHYYSQGKDSSPILSLYPPDQITFTQNFSHGLNKFQQIEEIFKKISCFFFEELQRKSKGCQTLKLRINDSLMERNFSPPACQQDILLTNLFLIFKGLKIKDSLSKITATATDLKPLSYQQLTLFEVKERDEKIISSRLELTIANLKKRYKSLPIYLGKDLPLTRREEILKFWDPFRF